MSLTGTTNEAKIWNFFIDKGINAFGTAGLMGNLYAESGLNPKNLQNSFEKKLHMTDAAYTDAVDNGSYDNFIKDSAGYGLAQWTFWSRKENLLQFSLSRKASIGDLEMQLEFLYKELSDDYKGVLEALKNAASVKEASNVVLLQYERPADQGNSVQSKRASFGQKYYDKYAKKAEGGKNNMTEAQLRQKVVGVLQGWIGRKESDGSHKEIIDIYNAHKPLARGYAVKYTDAWCATCVSAAAIVAGLTDIIPTECGCTDMIALFKKLGAWEENDAYTPELGDVIFYDWQDSGAGDNNGIPDHVGVVEKISGATLTVIEGNKNNAVERRNLQVNGRYIRGYGVPKYSSKADAKDEPVVSGNLKIGDVVNFTGSKHYASSYSGAKQVSCRGGKAKVTAISKGKPHPYHLIAANGGGSNVYGWVDADDIEGVSVGNSEIKVGDIVEYSGNVHYSSSYAGAKAVSCKGGTAKVTAISKGKPHSYHLVHTGKGCTVYGWVDADKVSR